MTDDGTITTGVGVGNVPPAYRVVVDDAVATLTDLLGDPLHSIYLYGSVATGQARPPRSDLDLIVALHVLATDRVARARQELRHRHRTVVRDVSVGSVLLDTLRGDDRTAVAERCFLKHYAAHLSGPDLRAAYPTCRASVELAVGFNGDLAVVLDDLRERLDSDLDDVEREDVAARACRKILLAAATLLSAREGGWSTDRGTAVDLIARRAPALRPVAADALAHGEGWAPPGCADVREIVDRLGGWLAAEYERAGSPRRPLRRNAR